MRSLLDSILPDDLEGPGVALALPALLRDAAKDRSQPGHKPSQQHCPLLLIYATLTGLKDSVSMKTKAGGTCQETGAPAGRYAMGNYILIRHKVMDFSTWKRVYDGHIGKRTEAGLTEKYLLRGVGDPNEVTILFEARDIAKAKAFGESPDLRDRMKEGGVIGKPDIYFLTEEKTVGHVKAA
jgi:hypothetical protein